VSDPISNGAHNGVEPIPVAIAGVDAPIPVQVVDPRDQITGPGGRSATAREPIQRQSTDPSLPATTTFQQDVTARGQRHINVMWERTQQIIAVAVTLFTLTICAFLIGRGPAELKLLAFTLLSNVFFLVVGTYFQRTNHTKTGGVSQNEVTR